MSEMMSEMEKQAILAEQAGRVEEAKARLAQQPPAAQESPGVVQRILELLRRGVAEMQAPKEEKPLTVNDIGAALPSAVMPHEALKKKEQERLQIEQMLRDSGR